MGYRVFNPLTKSPDPPSRVHTSRTFPHLTQVVDTSRLQPSPDFLDKKSNMFTMALSTRSPSILSRTLKNLKRIYRLPCKGQLRLRRLNTYKQRPKIFSTAPNLLRMTRGFQCHMRSHTQALTPKKPTPRLKSPGVLKDPGAMHL